MKEEKIGRLVLAPETNLEMGRGRAREGATQGDPLLVVY